MFPSENSATAVFRGVGPICFVALGSVYGLCGLSEVSNRAMRRETVWPCVGSVQAYRTLMWEPAEIESGKADG